MKRKAGSTYHPVVHYPSTIEEEGYVGDLFGYFHEESNEYNVVNFDSPHKTRIGEIQPYKPVEIPQNMLTGFYDDGKLIFHQGEQICEKNPFDLIMNIFSRNSGLIESTEMLGKKAVICGLGSVGSLVALELARSGVGNFLLIDIDTLAYHNICRHQLGIADIGRFKVSAVKDRILQINPHANITTQNIPIEEVEKGVFDSFITGDTVIAGCADNIEGDLYANKISKIYKIPFISIGLWERAFAGEIFYSLPGKTPCYECMFDEERRRVISFRPSQNHRFYTNEENLEDVQFEPGIAVDINFVSEIGVKLIIDILNINNHSYVPKLINHLTQFTLVCNTIDKQIGGDNAGLFSYPLQVTTSIKLDYSDSCRACKIT
jgi:molybdopterin/thiamine biosynthesis adenylyltransferase